MKDTPFSFLPMTKLYNAPVAGGFHHWIVYNIPAGARQLQGNHAFTEGTNSFGFVVNYLFKGPS
jgi:phosphatidylethanolamine-binding protein (PEBP) family uncharacterized protein